MTVVTDQRYEPLVRAQLPGANVLVEPAGRNTAAAIALATVDIDRPDDDVMIVLPADHYIRPTDEGVFRDVLRTAATGSRRVRSGRTTCSSRSGSRSCGRRPSTAT